jgi:hypothetical protein
MTKRRAFIAIGLCSLAVCGPPAFAQNAVVDALAELKKRTQPATVNDSTKEAQIDLSVPKSPAFTVLGITPESVVRPTSSRAFAASLLNGADPHGNIQTGLAIETAPYLLYAGDNITLKQYQDVYAIRAASRTQFSLATTKGATDEDKATRVALGLLITPFDLGDARTDKLLLKCFEQKVGKVHEDTVKVQHEIAPLVATGSPDWSTKLASEINKLEKRAKDEAEACRDEARKRHWNASAWSVGVAPTWTTPTGNVSDLDWSGAGLWTSVSYGFENVPGLEDTGQLIVHARYRIHERAPDPQQRGAFLTQDTLTLAGQVRVAGFSFRKTTGGPDLNFLFEAAYVHEDRQRRRDEGVLRYTAGFDYRITENLYLDVSIGTENGRKEGGNNQFGTFGLKWAFSDKPSRNVK